MVVCWLITYEISNLPNDDISNLSLIHTSIIFIDNSVNHVTNKKAPKGFSFRSILLLMYHSQHQQQRPYRFDDR